MSDSSHKNFSVINTDLELIKDGGKIFVKKYFQLNVDFPCPLKRIKEWIDTYINQLCDGGINMPAIQDSFIEANRIVYICDYAGENIIQIFPNIEDLLTHNDIFEAMCNILRIAQVNKLYIDPHPKNFVVMNRVVSYVDFSPPYQIKAYRDARLQIETDLFRQNIIKNNFDVFHPKNVFYHFIGDFISITNNRKLNEQIYNKIRKKNFVDLPIISGMEKASQIRKTEDLKFTHNIYLM